MKFKITYFMALGLLVNFGNIQACFCCCTEESKTKEQPTASNLSVARLPERRNISDVINGLPISEEAKQKVHDAVADFALEQRLRQHANSQVPQPVRKK